MKNTFEVSTPYSHVTDCVLVSDRYANNDHIALEIFSLEEGPFANLTVNLPDTKRMPENYGFVDVNNFPQAEAVIAKLGIGKPTGRIASSGFCFYPLYEFDPEKIAEYAFTENEEEGEW